MKVSHQLGQTMAFLTLSSTQLFHAYNIKSNSSIFHKKSYQNKFMNVAFLIGFGLQIFVIYCPKVRDLFGFQLMKLPYLLVCIGLSLTLVVIMEIVKLICRHKGSFDS